MLAIWHVHRFGQWLRLRVPGWFPRRPLPDGYPGVCQPAVHERRGLRGPCCELPVQLSSRLCGNNCEIQINECVSNPCRNGGQCQDLIAGYRCTCPSNYAGPTCDIFLDVCSSNPCKNGGFCLNTGEGQFTCTCLPGFISMQCEQEVNECESAPCQNEGNCVDLVNGYQCMCAAGYLGNNCQLEIDECQSNPCLNSGTCTDAVNGYTCACTTNWAGTTCEMQSRCVNNPCQNGAVCNEPAGGGTGNAVCICLDGFTGGLCETDVDDCVGNPCGGQGTCVDGVNSFTCECAFGYAGDTCNEVRKNACCR
ncbi:fibropellin-3-like [Strongylocentrotus purpuratus]|uniref:EGF-like domain-containing protein n=1 Tax=Strongylocentrotus purpuratus TaxID=7668 RepID=A0A7M7NIS6_STRPU|nr:fibropellin-3-like [Strongylocentrotus purpuratus]